MADLTGGKTEQKKREHAEESKKRKEPESRTTIDMKIRTVPIHRTQLGYFVPFTFSSPKLVFPGLFLHKLTEKNTHRVFASVILKFELENIENNTNNSSNIEFSRFGSQNFVELYTAYGNT